MQSQFESIMSRFAGTDTVVPANYKVETPVVDDYHTAVESAVNEDGSKKYPNLTAYTNPVKTPERDIVGRDKEMDQVLAALSRAELSNIMLLAEAGTGKTALVQGVMMKDTDRLYLEVNLSAMIADLNDPNQMGERLKQLFAEVEKFREENEKDIVLFMDEFHQIVALSAAAVEALKPLLADSGTRGVRVIAATTFIEFRQYIQPNQPLVERFERINLNQPDKATTVLILRGMAKRYGVADQIPNDTLFEQIYDYTQRYIPANSQPRKSILVLDAMVGWNRYKGRRLNQRLLADVIYESEGINVTFRVDGSKIKENLDKEVIAQDYATTAIEQRLQICCADLNDTSRPMSSFLFCGSTGVGKTATAKALAKLLFDDERRLIRFDMTEFANDDSLDTFRKELTNQVWARPYSIILLDEIEKASGAVTRLLLQVLDDGRLMDENNREVTFTNSYIILTTNAGSEVFNDIGHYHSSDTGSGDQLFKYDSLIRKSITETTGANRFPPELLGRIDCLVPFQPLSTATQKKIVLRKIHDLIEQVKTKRGVVLKVNKDVVEYICVDSIKEDADAGGARAAIAKLNSEVVTAVARFINENPDAERIVVDMEGEMASQNKYKLESTVRIVVREMISAKNA